MANKLKQRRSQLLGVGIGVCDLDTLLDQATSAVATKARVFTFACANPHSLITAQKDPEFLSALRSFSAVVADGVGVKLAGVLATADVGPRITGTDFFLGLMQRLNDRGYGCVTFLGSVEPVLEKVRQRTAKDFPNVVVKTVSPPFGDWTTEQYKDVIRAVRQTNCEVLWVGMTAPRQEKWIHRYSGECGASVIGAVGAVFDYYAGTIKRAPDWICSLGFEWLFRLLGEPRRLWRRTLVSGPLFLYLVAREHLSTARRLRR